MSSVRPEAVFSSARTRATRGCFAVLLALTVPVVAAAGPWVLRPGEFQSEVTANYFSTTTFLDDNGERPPLGGTYESRSMRWSNELGWKKRMSFRLDVPFESVTGRIGDGVTPEFTNTGLSDLLVGFNIRVVDGLSLEANWKAPLGYNKDLFPALGNGHQEAIGLLHLGFAVPAVQGFLQVAGGYQAVIDAHDGPNDPNDFVLATADAGFWIGPSLLLLGNYRGAFESQGNEVAPGVTLTITSHQAGPQLLYRVDDFLDVYAGSLHTASGKNVLHTDQFYVGITTHKTHYDRLRGFVGTKKRS